MKSVLTCLDGGRLSGGGPSLHSRRTASRLYAGAWNERGGWNTAELSARVGPGSTPAAAAAEGKSSEHRGLLRSSAGGGDLTFPTLYGGCWGFFLGRSCSVVKGVKVGGRENVNFGGGGLLLRLIFLSGFFFFFFFFFFNAVFLFLFFVGQEGRGGGEFSL